MPLLSPTAADKINEAANLSRSLVFAVSLLLRSLETSHMFKLILPFEKKKKIPKVMVGVLLCLILSHKKSLKSKAETSHALHLDVNVCVAIKEQDRKREWFYSIVFIKHNMWSHPSGHHPGRNKSDP